MAGEDRHFALDVGARDAADDQFGVSDGAQRRERLRPCADHDLTRLNDLTAVDALACNDDVDGRQRGGDRRVGGLRRAAGVLRHTRFARQRRICGRLIVLLAEHQRGNGSTRDDQ